MPALNCPYCDAYANFTIAATIMSGHDWRERGHWEFVDIVALTCDACGSPIVAGRAPAADSSPSRLKWHQPVKVVNRDFPDVPDHIASDASEAFRCSAVEAWRATVAIARRAIQAAAFEQGAPDKKLQQQIDWLDDQRKITPQMRDMAHEIRLSGNDGAHPDKDGLKDVGKNQAEAVLTFLEDFLRHLYQMPARLEAARSKAVETPASPADVPAKEPTRWPPQPGS